jgi:hypothetical protein
MRIESSCRMVPVPTISAARADIVAGQARQLLAFTQRLRVVLARRAANDDAVDAPGHQEVHHPLEGVAVDWATATPTSCRAV